MRYLTVIGLPDIADSTRTTSNIPLQLPPIVDFLPQGESYVFSIHSTKLTVKLTHKSRETILYTSQTFIVTTASR